MTTSKDYGNKNKEIVRRSGLTNKEKNQVVYRLALNYLLDILPNQLDSDDSQKYFIGDRRDFSSLADVFEQLIQSAQNYQRMPNVIKFTERKERLRPFYVI